MKRIFICIIYKKLNHVKKPTAPEMFGFIPVDHFPGLFTGANKKTSSHY